MGRYTDYAVSGLGGSAAAGSDFMAQQALVNRINLLSRNVPGLANIPEATYALASDFSMDDGDMLRGAYGAIGASAVMQQIESLSSLDDYQQRAVWGTMDPVAQETLRRAGYTPPQVEQKGGNGIPGTSWIKRAVNILPGDPAGDGNIGLPSAGGVGDQLTFMAQGLGNAVGLTAETILKAGNAPYAQATRAWRMGAAMIDEAGSPLNVMNPMGSVGPAFAAMGAARMGPTGLWELWQNVGDGEEYVHRDYIDRAARVLGNQEVASGFFDDYGGNLTTVSGQLWLARKMNGGHDLAEIARDAGFTEGTDEWNRFIVEAMDVSSTDKFQEALGILGNGKSSLGRDMLRGSHGSIGYGFAYDGALGRFKPFETPVLGGVLGPLGSVIPAVRNMTLGQITSGVGDAAFAWYADPFDRGFDILRARRAMRFGADLASVNEARRISAALANGNDTYRTHAAVNLTSTPVNGQAPVTSFRRKITSADRAAIREVDASNADIATTFRELDRRVHVRTARNQKPEEFVAEVRKLETEIAARSDEIAKTRAADRMFDEPQKMRAASLRLREAAQKYEDLVGRKYDDVPLADDDIITAKTRIDELEIQDGWEHQPVLDFHRRRPGMRAAWSVMYARHLDDTTRRLDSVDGVWDFWSDASAHEMIFKNPSLSRLDPDRVTLPGLTALERGLPPGMGDIPGIAKVREMLWTKFLDPEDLEISLSQIEKATVAHLDAIAKAKAAGDAEALELAETAFVNMMGHWTANAKSLPGQRFLRGFLTHQPRGRVLALTGDESIDMAERVFNLGRALNVPENIIDQYRGLYLVGNVAERNEIMLRYFTMMVGFSALRGEHTDELVEQFLRRARMAFGIQADGDGFEMVNGLRTKAGLFMAESDDLVLLPDIREFLKASNQTSVIRTLGGVITDSWIEAKMGKIWVPAQLMRIGFIPRAAGEETISFILRRSPKDYVAAHLALAQTGLKRTRRMKFADDATFISESGSGRRLTVPINDQTREAMLMKPITGLTYWLRELARVDDWGIRDRVVQQLRNAEPSRNWDEFRKAQPLAFEEMVQQNMQSVRDGLKHKLVSNTIQRADDMAFAISNRTANGLHKVAGHSKFLSREKIAGMFLRADDTRIRAARLMMMNPLVQGAYARMAGELYQPYRGQTALESGVTTMKVYQHGEIVEMPLKLDLSNFTVVSRTSGGKVLFDPLRYEIGLSSQYTRYADDPVAHAGLRVMHNYVGDGVLTELDDFGRKWGYTPAVDTTMVETGIPDDELAELTRLVQEEAGVRYQQQAATLDAAVEQMGEAARREQEIQATEIKVRTVRRQMRDEAGRRARELHAELDRYQMTAIAPPPPRATTRDMVTGAKRSSRPAEWEWYDNLDASEKARLRKWFQEGSQSPDQAAARMMDETGRSFGEVMEEWVAMTRRIDAHEAFEKRGASAIGRYKDDLVDLDDEFGLTIDDVYADDAYDRVRAAVDYRIRGQVPTPEAAGILVGSAQRGLDQIVADMEAEIERLAGGRRLVEETVPRKSPQELVRDIRRMHDQQSTYVQVQLAKWLKTHDREHLLNAFNKMGPEARRMYMPLLKDESVSGRLATIFAGRNMNAQDLIFDRAELAARVEEAMFEAWFAPGMEDARAGMHRTQMAAGHKIADPVREGQTRLHMPAVDPRLMPVLKGMVGKEDVTARAFDAFITQVMRRLPMEARDEFLRYSSSNLADAFGYNQLNGRLLGKGGTVTEVQAKPWAVSLSESMANELRQAQIVGSEAFGLGIFATSNPRNARLLSEAINAELAARAKDAGVMVSVPKRASRATAYVDLDDAVIKDWEKRIAFSLPHPKELANQGWFPLNGTYTHRVHSLPEDELVELTLVDFGKGNIRWVDATDPNIPELKGKSLTDEMQSGRIRVLRTTEAAGMSEERAIRELVSKERGAIESVLTTFHRDDLMKNDVLNEQLEHLLNLDDPLLVADDMAFNGGFDLFTNTPIEELPPDIHAPTLVTEDMTRWDKVVQHWFDGAVSPAMDAIIRSPLYLDMFARAMDDGRFIYDNYRRSLFTAKVMYGHEKMSVFDAFDKVADELPIFGNAGFIDDLTEIAWRHAYLPDESIDPSDPMILIARALQKEYEDFEGHRRAMGDLNEALSAATKMPVEVTAEQYDVLRRYMRIEATAKTEWVEASSQRAVNLMTPFIDDHRIRSHFQGHVGSLIPFWFAEEQFLKRWARGLYENPAMLRKGQLYVHGMRELGIIQEDGQGNEVFVYPGSEYVMDAIGPAIGAVWGDEARTVMSNPLSARVEYMLPGISPEAGRFSFGPLAAIPMMWAANREPDLMGPVNNLLGDGGMSRMGVGYDGNQTNLRLLTDNLLPASIRNAWNIAGNSQEAQASARMQAMQYLAAAGYAPEENDPNGMEEFLGRVRNISRLILIARAASGFTLGASGNVRIDEDVELDQDFQELLDAGLPFDQAVGAFIEKHPDASPYTVFRSRTESGAPIPATEDAFGWMTSNEAFISNFKTIAPWMIPQGKSEEYGPIERRARNQALAMGLRINKTDEEIVRQFYWAEAAEDYFRIMDDYTLEIAELNARNMITERQQVQAEMNAWKAAYLRQHPIFAEDLQSTDGRQRRARLIEEARLVLAAPEQIPEFPHEQEFITLLQLLVDFDDRMKSVSGLQSGDAQEFRERSRAEFYNLTRQIVRRYPALETFWQSNIRPLLGSDVIAELEVAGV